MRLRGAHLPWFGSCKPLLSLPSDSNLHRLHPHFAHLSLRLESWPEQQSTVTVPGGQEVISISCGPWWTRAGIRAEDRVCFSLSCQQLGYAEGQAGGLLWKETVKELWKLNPKKQPSKHTQTITTTPRLETGWAEGMKWAGRRWSLDQGGRTQWRRNNRVCPGGTPTSLLRESNWALISKRWKAPRSIQNLFCISNLICGIPCLLKLCMTVFLKLPHSASEMLLQNLHMQYCEEWT